MKTQDDKNTISENNKPWFEPQNLVKSFLDVSSTPVEKVDPNSDFGSYKMVREANALTKKSNIKSHVFTDLKGLTHFYKQVFKLPSIINHKYSHVVDIGCGLGFATEACRLVTQAECYGVEISSDATEYAQNNFKNCKFIAGAVDPADPNCKYKALVSHLSNTTVIASEFYPFTRTNDAIFHQQILNHIFNSQGVNSLIMVNSTRYLKEASQLKSYLSSISQWNEWGYNTDNHYILTPNLSRYIPSLCLSFVNKIVQKIIPIGRGTMHIAVVTKKNS